MEREKLEVTLEQERDCNRVSKSKYIAVIIIQHKNTLSSKYNSMCCESASSVDQITFWKLESDAKVRHSSFITRLQAQIEKLP